MSWRYGQLLEETERYSAIMDTAFNFTPLMLTQGEALIMPPQIARTSVMRVSVEMPGEMFAISGP